MIVQDSKNVMSFQGTMNSSSM